MDRSNQRRRLALFLKSIVKTMLFVSFVLVFELQCRSIDVY